MFQLQGSMLETGLNDTGLYEYGQNIYGSYFARPQVYGNKILQGVKTRVLFAEFLSTWQIKRISGFVAEFRLVMRQQSNINISGRDLLVSAGLRCALDRFYLDR
jgi:hypothetical protein